MRALLIRANRNEGDAVALSDLGIESEIDPYLTIEAVPNSSGARRMLVALLSDSPKWLIVTSTNVLTFWGNLLEPGELETAIRSSAATRFAAIGTQTKNQLLELGAKDVVVASQNDSSSVAEELSETDPMPVVLPTGSISMKNIPETLSARGFEIISEVVYQTEAVTTTPLSVEKIKRGLYDCVVLRSPSAARAFLGFNPELTPPIICAGRATARQVEALGFLVAAISESPSSEDVARAALSFLKGIE